MVRFADSSQVEDLADDMAASPARLRAGASRVVAKTTYDTEADMKVFCPVDTGTMLNSISSDVDELVGTVGPTVNYAPFVEDGTSRMSPQPFVRPAYDRNEPGFVQALADLTEDLL